MEVAEVREFTSHHQHSFAFGATGERADRTGRIDGRLSVTDGSPVKRMHAEIRNRRKLHASTLADRHATWPVYQPIGWIVVGDADFGQPVAILKVSNETIVQCAGSPGHDNRDEKREPRQHLQNAARLRVTMLTLRWS